MINKKHIEDILTLVDFHASKSGYNEKVRIVAATKTFSCDYINTLADLGITEVGENRAQELLEKYEGYDKRFKLHFIGQLQTNKVRQIIDKVDLIQSLDRAELAYEIQKRAAQKGIIAKVLVEVNIGGEESKGGLPEEQVLEFVENTAKSCPNVLICGLMSLLPKGASQSMYLQMRSLYDILRKKGIPNTDISILSMGMSEDYITAIQCGSNMIRLGRALLGERNG